MIDIKYIMTSKGPIIFLGSLSHVDFKHFNPTSAGFVSIDIDKKEAKAIKSSFSLGIGPGGNDSDILTLMLFPKK
jgi:hypothetical protein